MDWQVITSLVVSVGALLAYFAMGKPDETTPQGERKIQGNYAWRPAPAAQIDDEVIDRFANALKAQVRS